MIWHLLDSGPGAAAMNMALDEALLEHAAGLGRPVLRFYGWTTPAATFGHLQPYARVENVTTLRPLIRRPTGGGVVPHDADWTYSLTVPPGHEWHALAAVASYRRMHEWIRAACRHLHCDTELAPTARKPAAPGVNPLIPGACFEGYEAHDLLWQGKKVAGAAQRRNRCGLLIQGSFQPPPSLNRQAWQQAMLLTGQGEHGIEWLPLTPNPALLQRAEDLARQKYLQTAYNRKR